MVPVWKNSRTLMFPEQHENSFTFNYSRQCAHHALPYAGQISQTEHVMEFCWCGQKMCLRKNKINCKTGSDFPISSPPSTHSHSILLQSSALYPHELLDKNIVIIHTKHTKILETITHITMCRQFPFENSPIKNILNFHLFLNWVLQFYKVPYK
jgi:hypothetical protein